MPTQEKVKKYPLKETEREELERLPEENEFLKLSIEYQKKLNASIQEKERKNKEKTKIILELRLKYPQMMLKTRLKISGIAKSSYYEWKEKLSKIVIKIRC